MFIVIVVTMCIAPNKLYGWYTTLTGMNNVLRENKHAPVEPDAGPRWIKQ